MSQSDREKLYELINDVKIAMLTTVEANGQLHTRPMASQEADENGALWFFTEKDGAVAGSIGSDPRLSLGYAGRGTYVAITGRGVMIDDRTKIDELWSEAVAAWFPKGKDDPNLTLLKVMPEIGEFWTYPAAPVSQVVGYVKAKLTGEPADDIGDNRRVTL